MDGPQSKRLKNRELDERAVYAIKLAALVRNLLDLAVIAPGFGLDLPAVEQVVKEALGLQLLAERRDGALASYAFRQAFTREAFADELVAQPDRRHAHLRIAAALRAGCAHLFWPHFGPVVLT